MAEKSSAKHDSSSIVSQLLAEEIGGNCLTSFFFTINPTDDMNDNLMLLNLLDPIRQILNFPTRNDENFVALKRQIRKTMREESKRAIEIAKADWKSHRPQRRDPKAIAGMPLLLI